jgi:hypothetical protein
MKNNRIFLLKKTPRTTSCMVMLYFAQYMYVNTKYASGMHMKYFTAVKQFIVQHLLKKHFAPALQRNSIIFSINFIQDLSCSPRQNSIHALGYILSTIEAKNSSPIF